MASRSKDDVLVNKINETEELLVFGYSCKLFRDDEKALFIDQGKHLIPWMGDETLKIDRYDARGTLYDLSQHEAPSGGFDRFFGLTDMEKQVETMCDEERYRAMFTNEEEETMYQEEELKRFHNAIGDKGNSYSQVEYKYEGESNDAEESSEKVVERSDDGGEDEPFVPSPLLDLPCNMVVPETVKHNQIIEKTAMFINSQGPQMEILLKMKQAGNQLFNFLSFDNPLHSYYRHLLMAIKGGRFKPDIESGGKKSDTENDDDDHYLHPSLASSVSKVELAPSIPSINYKPSAHCAYSMLVNKIKDKKLSEQANQISKLKEAINRIKDDKKTGENGCENENSKANLNNQCSNVQTFPMPPADMQVIIDKMASYVAKNGRDFEAVVQMKNDPRFDFLHPSHTYNAYYQFKVRQYENLEKTSKPEVKLKVEGVVSTRPKEDQTKGGSKFTPVCFSIKKPKDSEPVIEKSALPLEESSDEEGSDEKKEKDASEEREKEKEKEKDKEEIVTVDLVSVEEKEEKNRRMLAAERLKDKLTAAAREKMAMSTKEKQLQLERKRRAAVFLKAINPDSNDGQGSVVYGPQLPDAETLDFELEEGSDVASIPEGGDDSNMSRSEGTKLPEETEFKRIKIEREHRSSNSNSRHKHREKHRSRGEKTEKTVEDELKSKEINDRISDSFSSSDEDGKHRGGLTERSHKTERRSSEECQWRTKGEKYRDSGRDRSRRKKRKHKKNDTRHRSSRKHSKLKRERRGRESDDNSNSRSKRSRRNSSDSSDDLNS